MAKHRILALAASLCLLTGCGAVSQEAVQSTPPAPAVSAEELPSPPPQEREIVYAVTRSTSRTNYVAEDGTPILAATFHYPVLSAVRPDGMAIEGEMTEREAAALAAAERFNECFASWANSDGVSEDAAIAMEDYAFRKAEGIEGPGGYDIELDCTVYRAGRMVSVRGLYYVYIGGAHPNTAHLAWNFDLESGDFFGPEHLGGEELRTAVTEELKLQSTLRAQEYGAEPAELYWTDYESILADWQSAAVSFGDTGMTVAYSPYELAPYAFGPQIYEIPYEFLEPYLSLQGMDLLGLVTPPGAELPAVR